MKRRSPKTLPEKANVILMGLLVIFFLILARVGTLAIILHDQKCAEARRPQKRTVVERAERASIADRYGELLATNQVQYRVGFCYGQIGRIPRTLTKRNERGKKEKTFPRKEYISKIAELIANALEVESDRIEDIIYAKAAILGNTPYIFKENISEATYFQLKMKEKDWPGLMTEVAAKRVYPHGRLAAESVGYIGPISREKYESVLEEMTLLKEALAEDSTQTELVERLQEIEKMSYSFNDFTGKVGIEATCDERLRGQSGKRVYLTDIKGNFLHELEESILPIPGEQIRLTLSCELQAYAEQLLTEYSQELPSAAPGAVARRQLMPEHRPWVKEGAIVAIDPKTGEVLALASFPRYDPNDFIPGVTEEEKSSKRWHVGRWLETNEYLGGVWDQRTPLVCERFDRVKGESFEQQIWVDWPFYLSMTIPNASPLMEILNRHQTIADAVRVQAAVDHLVSLFPFLTPIQLIDLLYQGEKDLSNGVMITLQERDLFTEKKEEVAEQLTHCLQLLAPYFSHVTANSDKLLLIDLYRLVVDPSRFTPQLLQANAGKTLTDYRSLTAHFAAVHTALKEIMTPLFHDYDFKNWRTEHFKQFLAKKRREEKLAGLKYSKPYIDYLDVEEKRQFDLFWQANQFELLSLFLRGGVGPAHLECYSPHLAVWFNELKAGAHHALPWRKAYLALTQVELPLLQTFRPFDQLNRSLYGQYPQLRCDEATGERRECHLAMGFYPRYGHGHLRSHAFRQAATIGSIFKLVPAYAALMQMYEGGGRGVLNPLTIIDNRHKIAGKGEQWNVGFFSDGRSIPLYYHGGRLPKSDHAGIGKVDLVGALEVSSNPYFAVLAGDFLKDPEDLCDAARLLGFGEKTGIELTGEYGGNIPSDVTYNRTGLYSMSIGQHTLLTTPLQTAVMLSSLVNGGKILKPKIIATDPPICRWQFNFPEPVKRQIQEGMRAVMMGERGTGRFIRNHFPPALIAQTIGKTSTAEVVENYGCDSLSRYIKTKSIWFGCALFDPRDGGKMEDPELVVVVYLKQGEYGRLSIPYALKMVQKWREIKKTHQEEQRLAPILR